AYVCRFPEARAARFMRRPIFVSQSFHCEISLLTRRRGENKHPRLKENRFGMPELQTPATGEAQGTSAPTPLTQREKRDLQKSQLRPLANRRPELYEEDEYSSAEYDRMLEMYAG